jgi:hypothetical protein
VRILIVICTLLTLRLSAQLDSNYVADYKARLVVSVYQALRSHELDITQTSVADPNAFSSLNYKASSRLVNGFGMDWDKIGFALSWKTPAEKGVEDRTGKSRARNLSFGLNLKKLRIESSYRYYKGFYDSNTSNIENFDEGTPYFQNPELEITSLKVKAIYFRNKKNRFSYAAAYANTQRQLKSAMTFVLLSNVYFQEIGSHTGIIPDYMKPEFYQGYRELNHIRTAGISVNPGVSANIVIFKRLFVNGTISYGPELQFRRLLNYNNGVRKELKLSMTSGDARFSFGYNGKLLSIYSWLVGDYDYMKFNDLQINRRLINSGITLGYRFPVIQNRFTRYIKENRYYQKI